MAANGSGKELFNMESRQDHLVDSFQFMAFGVVAAAICILGLVGNGVSIRVLMSKRMKTSTSIYLIALAVWDMLILFCFLLVFSLPVLFKSSLGNFFTAMSPHVVYLVYPLSLTAHTATVYITVGFTVERFVAVCFPLKAAQWCSRQKARRVVAVIVIYSFFYNIPRFFESLKTKSCPSDTARSNGSAGENGSSQLSTPSCEPMFFRNHPLYRSIYLNFLYVSFMFLFPFVLLIVMNAFLIRAVRKSERSTAEESRCFRKSRRRDTNLTMMLISVVVVFLVCQAFALVDNVLIVIWSVEITGSDGYMIFYTISQVLVVFNSAINFILYCCFGRKFRRAFIFMFSCSVCEERRLDDTNGTMSAINHRMGASPHVLRRHSQHSYQRVTFQKISLKPPIRNTSDADLQSSM